MIALAIALFTLAALVMVVWAGVSTHRSISKLYQEKELLESLPTGYAEGVDATPDAEVMRLCTEGKTRKGVGVAEQALCSVLMFQTGSPPDNATLDATVLGLRALEALDGSSPMTLELLSNFAKSAPDFLRSHLDQGVGGAKCHIRSYPNVYGSYYFLDGLNLYYRLTEKNRLDSTPLTFDHFKDFVGLPNAKKFVEFIEYCQVDLAGQAVAFSETPGSPIGTITTGGAIQILCNLLSDHDLVVYGLVENLTNKITKVASYIDMCKQIQSLKDGEDACGFSNNIGYSRPQTVSTRHALKTYSTISILAPWLNVSWTIPQLDASAIAKFYSLCKDNHGFSRIPYEPASVYYTDQVLCSSRYYPFTEKPQELRSLVEYKATLEFVASSLYSGGFGFERESYPNIYATRAAGHIIVNMRKLYNENERDPRREEKIISQVRNALCAHFDVRTGLAVGYRPIQR
jgi:hypothetical protein